MAIKQRQFVAFARARGASDLRIIYRHIAPNMVGAIGEAGLGALRFVLAGLVIVEYLLVWPGLGVLALRAAAAVPAVRSGPGNWDSSARISSRFAAGSAMQRFP